MKIFGALVALAVLGPVIAVGLIVAATPRHPSSINKGQAR